MATTFEVLPATRKDLTFGELLDQSQKNISLHLHKLGITHEIQLRAEIITNKNRREVPPDKVFKWSVGPPDYAYLWISLNGVPGGTDVYCDTISSRLPEHKWHIFDELREALNFNPVYERLLGSAKKLDRRWRFRRSMGQPEIINLSYGIIAATLAELTDGLIYSCDGAWNDQFLPTTGAAFRAHYFSPDSYAEQHSKKWVETVIASLQESVFK